MGLNRTGLVALVMTLAFATPSSVLGADWAKKMFSETEHDFRTVGRGTKAEYRFEFKNLYEEDVHISAVRSSCGCTTPSLTKDLLATHESAAVVARFNTNSFIGQKSAVITVVFDRPYFAEVQLKVGGYISTNISFNPPEVDFGQVKSGQTVERQIEITHRGNRNWRITDVRSHCDDLQVRLDRPQLMSGQVRYRMTVRAKESMPEGDINEQLTLVSNDGRFPTVEMAITGQVQPTLIVSPEALNLGKPKPGQAVKKRLLIRGQEPFAITEIRCPDDRFQFALPEGRKPLHFLQMTFSGDEPAQVAQRIEIVTDLPGNKTAKFIATGTIQGDIATAKEPTLR